MKDKRVLVLTGTTDLYKQKLDPSGDDDSMESVFNKTLNSKQKYAEKHGYDFMAIRSFGGNNLIETNDSFNNPIRDVGFSRVIKPLKMLEFYDIVMWIDADSLITNLDYPAEHFIKSEEHIFIASWDWASKNWIQTGNYILQKGEGLEEFFDTFCSTADKFAEEQQTINYMYSSTPCYRFINVLDNNYLNSIPSREMYGSVWNQRVHRPILWDWKQGDFLVHITGVWNRDRNRILDTHFKDYL